MAGDAGILKDVASDNRLLEETACLVKGHTVLNGLSMEEISSGLDDVLSPFVVKAMELNDGQVKIPSGPSVQLYRITSYKRGSRVPVKVQYLPVVEYTNGIIPPTKHVCGEDGSLYPIGPNYAEHGRYFRDNVSEDSVPDKSGVSRPFPIIDLQEHRRWYKGKDIPLATSLPCRNGGSATVHLIDLHPASLAYGHFKFEEIKQSLKDSVVETTS